jgi:hypothetical protein
MPTKLTAEIISPAAVYCDVWYYRLTLSEFHSSMNFWRNA